MRTRVQGRKGATDSPRFRHSRDLHARSVIARVRGLERRGRCHRRREGRLACVPRPRPGEGHRSGGQRYALVLGGARRRHSRHSTRRLLGIQLVRRRERRLDVGLRRRRAVVYGANCPAVRRPGTASTMGSVREPPRGRNHLLLVVQGRRRYSEGFRRSGAARRCVRVRVVGVEPLPSRGQRSGPGRLRSEHRLRVFRSLTLKPPRRASAGESNTVIRNTRSRRTQAGGTRGRRGSRAARDARGSRAGAPWRRARPVPRRRARGLSPPT